MSFARQAAAFAQKSAVHRAGAFGPATAPQGITYGGKVFPVVSVGTITSSEALGQGVYAGGWTRTVTTVIRILKSTTGFVPVENAVLVLNHTGQAFRITELRGGVPAEWVLGCANPESTEGV